MKMADRNAHTEVPVVIMGRQLDWLINLRWLAVVGIVSVITFVRFLLKIPLPLWQLYLGSLFLVLMNAGFAYFNRKLKDRDTDKSWRVLARYFANLMIFSDFFMLTYLIHFSGGVENLFMLYYVFHMVIGAILLPNRDAYLHACGAVTLWFAMCGAEYLQLIPHYHLNIFPAPAADLYLSGTYVAGAFWILGSSLFIVVYFTTSIVNRIRQEEARLAEALDRLSEVNDELAIQDRAKSRYVLTVSHDIQTSLVAVKTCLDVVLGDMAGNISDKAREMIARADQRSQSLLAFVKDLLNLSRIRSGSGTRAQSLRPAEIIRSVQEKLQERITGKKLAFTMENFRPEFTFQGDPDGLEQVFSNLIENAVKYTPRGGRISVVCSERPDGGLGGTISDNGIGVPAEDRERIFDDFYRAPNAIQMEKDGTGFGLSIVKQVVKDHHGMVRVDSKIGFGSTFVFEIPGSVITD